MDRFKPIVFNPDVKEYLVLNGYKQGALEALPGGMFFQNGKTAVQFWNSKIQVSKNSGGIWHTTHNFIGFDGQNIPYLMMLMHVMEVVNLNDAKKLSDQELLDVIRNAKSQKTSELQPV